MKELGLQSILKAHDLATISNGPLQYLQKRSSSQVSGSSFSGNLSIQFDHSTYDAMICSENRFELRVKAACFVNTGVGTSDASPLGAAVTGANSVNAAVAPNGTRLAISKNWALSCFNNISHVSQGVQVQNVQYPAIVSTAVKQAFGSAAKGRRGQSASLCPAYEMTRLKIGNVATAEGTKQLSYDSATGELNYSSGEYLNSVNQPFLYDGNASLQFDAPMMLFAPVIIPGSCSHTVTLTVDSNFRNYLFDTPAEWEFNTTTIYPSVAAAKAASIVGTVTVGDAFYGIEIDDFSLWVATLRVLPIERPIRMAYTDFFWYTFTLNAATSQFNVIVPEGVSKLLMFFLSSTRGKSGTAGLASSSCTNFNTGVAAANNAMLNCKSLQVRVGSTQYPLIQYTMARQTCDITTGAGSIAIDNERAYEDFLFGSCNGIDRAGPTMDLSQWMQQKIFCFDLLSDGLRPTQSIEVQYIANSGTAFNLTDIAIVGIIKREIVAELQPSGSVSLTQPVAVPF